MPQTGPETLVEAPPQRPPPTGLLQAVPVLEQATAEAEHWLAGIRVRPPSYVGATLYDVCGTATLPETFSARTPVNFDPFVIEVPDRCSTWGWTTAGYRDRALSRLLVSETWYVEREFEQGNLLTGNPRLAQTVGGLTQTLAGGVVVSPADALALLDEAIANANVGQGLIHATAFIVAKWTEAYGLKGEGGQLRSPNGNIIVAGNGYTGLGPDGTGGSADATHALQWAYATDLLVVLRSDQPRLYPDTLAEATDRAANTVVYQATRPYAIAWPQLLHAAVKVRTSTPAVP